jgi:hypothetical protein
LSERGSDDAIFVIGLSLQGVVQRGTIEKKEVEVLKKLIIASVALVASSGAVLAADFCCGGTLACCIGLACCG